MIVRCIANEISFLKLADAKERVAGWIGLGGKYNDLEMGKAYPVQAIECLENGIFYYLHTIDISEHPYPFPSEFFTMEDSTLPADWEASLKIADGRHRLKR